MKKVPECPDDGPKKPQNSKMDRRDAMAKLGLVGLGLLVAPSVVTISEGHAGRGGGEGGGGSGGGRGGRGGG
ncbi:MAG: hypothetical protein WBN88_21565, partial [Anderseniella sp.]